jgi:hypothetical protein
MPRPHTDALLSTTRDWTGLMVNPVDAHPGPALHAAYAHDAASAVLAAFPGPIAAPRRSGTAQVVGTFPTGFTNTGRDLTLPAAEPAPCQPGEECCIRINTTTDQPCAPRGTFHYLINEQAVDPLYAPCMDDPRRRSYVEAYLSPGIDGPVGVRVRDGRVIVTAFRDVDGVRIWLEPFQLTPATPSARWTAPGIAGIRFTFDGATQCATPPPLQAQISLPE